MNAPTSVDLVLPFSAEQMRDQVNAIQKLMEAVMKEGEHYGRLPGSRKPSLWKPGAEKLCVAFHIQPAFLVEDLSTSDYYRYRVKCIGTHQITGTKLGEGMGTCSSMEQKFKWRKATDVEFGTTAEERRRLKHGYDWDTKRPYEVMQVRAEHHDIENTILKMACKRAHVAMTLNVTAASDIFAQDIEDLPEHLRADDENSLSTTAPIAQPRPKSKKETAPEIAAPAQPGKKANGGSTLSDGQRRILCTRMRKANLLEADLVNVFGAALEAIPALKFKDVAAWVRAAKQARA
jgi:hypothetical protein